MQSRNNIHVQQHKTNIIIEEWKKTQNDAPFVAFYDMRAVTFVLGDEMADVSIAGLQWFILIPRLNHMGSHRPIDSHASQLSRFDRESPDSRQKTHSPQQTFQKPRFDKNQI